MDKILITTHEATTLDQMAKDSAERWEKEKQLDGIISEYLTRLILPFEKLINCMEVARYFNCESSTEKILIDIKKYYPTEWQKYLQDTNK